MKLTYFGTAAAEGWPGMFCHCDVCKKAKELGGKNIRTRSQALVDDTLLVDFPPDSYMHMLHHGLDLPSIQHLLITHTHQDHLYLDEMLFRRKGFCSGVDQTLTLYGSDALGAKIDAYMKKWPGSTLADAHMAFVELTEYVPMDIAGYTVIPMLARHDRSEKCLIYLIGKGGKWILYGNDTGDFPAATWDFLKGRTLDLVSLDCTMGKLKEGTNHMGVPDLMELKQRLMDMGCISSSTQFVATHFSHNGQLLHEELEQVLMPEGYQVAYDGFTVQL